MRVKTVTALGIGIVAAVFLLRGGVQGPIASSEAAPTAGGNSLDDIIQKIPDLPPIVILRLRNMTALDACRRWNTLPMWCMPRTVD